LTAPEPAGGGGGGGGGGGDDDDDHNHDVSEQETRSTWVTPTKDAKQKCEWGIDAGRGSDVRMLFLYICMRSTAADRKPSTVDCRVMNLDSLINLNLDMSFSQSWATCLSYIKPSLVSATPPTS
jgi:hypothetical protein